MKSIYLSRKLELGLIGLCIYLLFSPLLALAGGGASEGGEIDWFFLTTGLLGGLALFLFGIDKMSEDK